MNVVSGAVYQHGLPSRVCDDVPQVGAAVGFSFGQDKWTAVLRAEKSIYQEIRISVSHIWSLGSSFPIRRLLAVVSYLSPRAQQCYKNLAEHIVSVAPDRACFRRLL